MKLQRRLEECVTRGGRDVAQNVRVIGGTSYASVAGRTAARSMIDAKRAKEIRKEKDGNFAIIIKAKDEHANLSSKQVKEKVMKNVSKYPKCESKSSAKN